VLFFIKRDFFFGQNLKPEPKTKDGTLLKSTTLNRASREMLVYGYPNSNRNTKSLKSWFFEINSKLISRHQPVSEKTFFF
jgi:hypothetical protein